MKRDFSEEARQELLSLVTQVENEKWSNLTDWVGDRWCDFEAWIGKLNIKDYIDNVNKYHKKVIDKNNTTIEDIDLIFKNVNDVSELYKSRFATLLADLREYKKVIDLLANTVGPDKGKYDANFVGKGLKNAINTYLESSDSLQIIATDGLTENEVENMDEAKLQWILDVYAAIILETIPNVKIGDKLEIPIGPNTSLYYSVSGKLNGTGDIDINYTIENQKVQLKDYDYTYDTGYGSSVSLNSDGDVSIQASSKNVTGTVSGGSISYSYEETIGLNKYNYNYTLDILKNEFAMEESVTTDLEGGSVTSTIGIKSSKNNSWKPLPKPVPVESPYTCKIPDFGFDWDTVGNVVVIGAVTYVVVKGATALALIPFTGGASSVLLVV